MIEKSNEIIHTDKYTELVLVLFYSVDRGKILLMRLGDFHKTGGNPTRMIADLERILSDVVQLVYHKCANEVVKIGNLLIQFPIAALKENEIFYVNYYDDMKKIFHIEEVDKRCGHILEKLGYMKKICNAQGEFVDEVPTSSEGDAQETSAAEEQEQ
jgi:hypothetical protein